MCGIIGYCGPGDATGFLLQALKALEYRGYDSAGIATIGSQGELQIQKRAGQVQVLEASLNGALSNSSKIGIGHTRWATHGQVNDENAHPHISYDGRVAIAHNGIIENYSELRASLQKQGVTLKSQTDSEVIAHLIAKRMEKGEDLLEATRRVAQELHGLSVVLAISTLDPDTIVGTRVGHAGSLIMGSEEGVAVLASNIDAVPDGINEFTSIDNAQVTAISRGIPIIRRLDGSDIAKTSFPISQHRQADKGDHLHFMHKEISEQPSTLQGAMRGRVDFHSRSLSVSELTDALPRIADSSRIIFTGMGSSYFVALSGARWMERFAGIPAYAEYAGELSDRRPVLGPNTTTVAITQSGETYDTLSAIDVALENDCETLLVTANPHSQAARISHYTMDIGTGLEVAVAGTKTVTSSIMTLYLMAMQIGIYNGSIPVAEMERLIDGLAKLPRLMNQTVGLGPEILDLVRSELKGIRNMLFLGRGDLYPVALESALKMKEVSYVHAEGCTASEMKHGLNALIDPHTPTVALVPSDRELRIKMISSINEVKTREGKVFAIANEQDAETRELADRFIPIPSGTHLLEPFLMMAPLQLMAYYTAIERGFNPDRPRNLAKTVTVA